MASIFSLFPVQVGAVTTSPVWRNGRRTGLKIVRMAIAGRFSRLLSKQNFARVFTLKFTFTYFYLVQLMCHFLQPKVAQKVAQKITHHTRDISFYASELRRR